MNKARISLLFSFIFFATLTNFLTCTMQEFNGNVENFQKILEQGKPVVVEFYLPNCPACKVYAAPFKTVANESSTITFLAVNSPKNQALQSKFGISSYPTTIIFDASGKKIMQHEGAMNAQGLREKVKKLQ